MRRTRTDPRSARGWVSLVSVLALGGLLGGWAQVAGAAAPPLHALHKAIEHSLAKRSAHMVLSVSVGLPGTWVTVMREVGEQTFGSPAEGSFTESVLAGPTGKTTNVPTLISGKTIYLQINGTWYEETAKQVEAAMGVSGSVQSGNPTELLGLLYQSGAKVTDLGRHELGGATLTKYHAVIDIAKRSKAPHAVRVTPQYIAHFEQLTGSSKLPVSVWVDSSGVVRDERFTMPLSHAGLKSMGLTGAPTGMSMAFSLRLSHFGVHVAVQPPSTAVPLPVGGTPAPAS